MTQPALRVGIFGATSALAQAATRRWAARHAALVLVARHASRLDAVAADARSRGAAAVAVRVAGFTSGGAEATVDAAWRVHDGLDCALLAWGALTDQARARRDIGYLAAELETNFVAFACHAEALAARMQAQGGGTLGLIGSVGGDRVRAVQYAYAAAKAGIDAYATGLRASGRERGVRVVVIKPGPMATPMTAHLRPGRLWGTPDAAGRAIVDGMTAGKRVVYVPAWWRPAMLALRLLPEAIFNRLQA